MTLKSGRFKICHQCQKSIQVAYRARLAPAKNWFFVCKPCCESIRTKPGYQYGGTWKGEKN